MLILLLALVTHLATQTVDGVRSRPADIAFRVQMIDPGFSESVAVADFNRDGRLDILSAEYWYEAPAWTKHKIRDIAFNGSYIDNFSDLPVDVDGDGFTDIVQIAYFARRIVWLRNPGEKSGPWLETEIDAVGPTEFAFLVDLNNDGKALEILPQFTGGANAPLSWYELIDRKWVKRVVSAKSYGHGIGAGDVNKDGRNDIITPAGWLEAPADVRAAGEWTLHQTDWASPPPPPGAPSPAPAPPTVAMREVSREDAMKAGFVVEGPSGALEFRKGAVASRRPGFVYVPGEAQAPARFEPSQPFRRMTREEALELGFIKEYAPGRFDMQDGAAMGTDGVVMVNERVLAQKPQTAQPPARPAEYAFMYAVDVNGDGRSDILTSMAHSYGVLWFEQAADGRWLRRMIDNTWANAHSSALADVNGDGQPDLVAAKRYWGRNGTDPAEREPMGIYWYQYRPGPKASVEWIRHIVDYGGRAGGGLQMVVEDIDRDGDRDIVTAGKTGLFLSENLTKPARRGPG